MFLYLGSLDLSHTSLSVMKYGQIAQRRFFHLAEEWFPFRTQYRPVSSYETTAAYLEAVPGSGVQRHTVYTGYRTSVILPPGLLEQISPYYRYDAILPGTELEVITDYQVVEIPNGRILSDNRHTVSIITADNALLGDVSYQYHPGRAVPAHEHASMRRRWFTEPRHLAGTVFSMLSGGGSAINYGHWLVDCLPRLHLLQKSGLFSEVDWFLVPAYSADFHRDSLRLLGVPSEKIVVASEDVHVMADRLIASSHPRGTRSMLLPEWMVAWHRASFLPVAPVTGKFPPLVYVSRRDSTARQIINEQEVEAYLSGLGYRTFALAELSFLDKIELFAGARSIVTSSGAGLNNLMYCPPGCNVLEIFPQGMVHAQFFSIASLLGLSYQHIICRPERQAHVLREGRNEDLLVEMSELKYALARLEQPNLKTAGHHW